MRVKDYRKSLWTEMWTKAHLACRQTRATRGTKTRKQMLKWLEPLPESGKKSNPSVSYMKKGELHLFVQATFTVGCLL